MTENGLNLEGTRVLIVGGEKSGVACALAAASRGAVVNIADKGEPEEAKARAKELEESGVTLQVGIELPNDLAEYDLVIPSPGVSVHSPAVSAVLSAGVTCLSEIEFAYRLFPHKRLVAITGTNGKTTVTKLVGHLLRTAGLNCLVGGNIGVPLVEVLSEAEEANWVVCEVSSFQLSLVDSFAPVIGAFLNFGEDHLDWHSDSEEYFGAKASMIRALSAGSLAVLNADDQKVASLARETKAKTIMFSGTSDLADGKLCFDGHRVNLRSDGLTLEAIVEDFSLIGGHNNSNAAAAAAVAYGAGVSFDRLAEGLSSFTGLSHRVQLVASIEGVSYIDDSKATNPSAAMAGLESFDEPVLLLLGGRNKGMDFSQMRESFRRAKMIICFGESGPEVCEALNHDCTEVVANLSDAVSLAASLSSPGDVVLLSPGCASFDAFSSYAERGDAFQADVSDLAGAQELTG